MTYQLTIQLGYPSTLLKAKNWEPCGLQKDDPAIKIQLNSHIQNHPFADRAFYNFNAMHRVISDRVGDAPFFYKVGR